MAEGGRRLLKAVIIGGTGATGKNVIAHLLKHRETVDTVTLFSRKRLELSPELVSKYNLSGKEEEDGRLIQHVEDLDTVSEDTVKKLTSGNDMFFCCIGSAAMASSQLNFHIDCEIPDRMAKMVASNGVRHASLLTAQGANANSWFQMIRTKGEVEERFKKAGFSSVSVFRPGMIEREGDSRFSEKVLRIFLPSINVSNLAKAMVQDAFDSLSSAVTDQESGSNECKSNTYEVADIKRIYLQSEL